MTTSTHTSTTTGIRRVTPEALTAFCVEALVRTGMAEQDAGTVAQVLVTTDTWGVYTHGTRHLRNYIRKIRAGGIDPKAEPTLIAEGPAWANLDGHGAIGMVPAAAAMNLAISKAKTYGISYVGVRRSSHFGAAGYYASLALPHNMIGWVMSNADPNMVAPGSQGSVIGNNPLAFAIPAGHEKPILIDIAMSAVASSKILAAKGLGLPIPDTWIVDADGRATTDTTGYPQVGSLQPMAAHKGYGLAVVVEVLAGVLSGAAVTNEIGSWISQLARPPGTGHAFVAIDVGTIMAVAEFKERVDAMIQRIHEAPLAQGAERIYLPGEIEWNRYAQQSETGIELPADVIDDVIGLGVDVGIDARPLFV